MSSKTVVFAVTIIAFSYCLIEDSQALPADYTKGFDVIQICLINCTQCKRMYGNYFQGQMCAESCMLFKGKIIPDCKDSGSIAPFLNASE